MALDQKQLKAIKLLVAGDSVPDVSRKTGIPVTTLYAYQGGFRRPEFLQELKRQRGKREERIKDLVLSGKRDSLEIVRNWLEKNKHKKDDETLKKCLSILNAYGKSGMNINIDVNVTMSAEERVNEFNRLRQIARQALDGTGISSADRN